MSKHRKIKAVTAVAALGAVAAVGAASGVLSSTHVSASSALVAPAVSDNRALPGSFSSIIERVSPAVVSIRVTGKATPVSGSTGPALRELPEPFKRFFGEDFAKRFGMPDGERRQRSDRAPRTQGMGSGFFIDADGHIVTNNHVVGNADKIEIILKDGETHEATLVGSDPKTDLALLKVKSNKSFPFVAFGDSKSAKVGDWVIALGNPFGLGHTATSGIVSARGRDIGAGPYDDFLQIEAPINRGNSGGPTFNMRGEVVGVNTAIISPTGVSAGIGFAIPSNLAKDIVAQLKATGQVARGWLGVHIQTVSADLAEGLGLDTAEGALVSDVTPDSPAAKAGIRQGDVIVAVGSERIEKLRELPRLIAGIPAEDTANLTVIRDGKEKKIEVRIGKMPEPTKVSATQPNDASETPRLGLAVAPLDDALRDRFNIEQADGGVVIVDVDKNGVAAEKGLRPGDVIRQVAGQPVKMPSDVTKAVRKADDDERKAVLFLINRNGNNRYVALPLRDA